MLQAQVRILAEQMAEMSRVLSATYTLQVTYSRGGAGVRKVFALLCVLQVSFLLLLYSKVEPYVAQCVCLWSV